MEPEQEPEPSSEEQAATMDTVTDAPSFFMGDKVTLSGEVDDVYTTRAFELEDDDDWFFEEALPVVTRSPISFAGGELAEEDELVVTGRIQKLVIADVERELGWDLDPEIETEWEGRPILIADSIRKMEEYARWSEEDEKQGLLVGITSVFFAPAPSELAGQKLEIENASVQGTAGDGVWIGPSDTTRLLVIPPKEQAAEISEGARVDVQGTLREMPPASEAVTKWNLKDPAVREITEEPLYLEAETISRLDEEEKQAQAKQTTQQRDGSAP